MADAVKAQKLAAARKRLKEYQQKTQPGKKTTKKDEDETTDSLQKNHTSPSENVTPADSMASSTHSAFDSNSAIIQENAFYIQDPNLKTSESPQPTTSTYLETKNPNYFNDALFQTRESNHLLSNYFDTMTSNHSLDAFSQNFANIQTKQSHIEPQILTDLEQNVNNEYADPLLDVSNVNIFLPKTSQDALNQLGEEETTTSLDRHKSECALDENLQTELNENQKQTISNTESLRQLSSQLNSLIDSETIQSITETSELERRNQELAALLENERLKTEQLNLQLREYLTRITQLETETQQMKNEHEAKISLEIGPLQEQLQYHVQTVGILVGEKTELTMALNQSQMTSKQKTGECEELQGRLKASRHRVAELEKELSLFKSTREHSDKHEQENNRELERLRLEYNLLKDQIQEATEESSELREKLNTKISECMSLQQEIQEKNSQLSLAQLKVQQLTSGENPHIESQLEILNQQKISFEQQIAELTQTVKVVSGERDQASQQYQQYVQQLNGQIENLADSLETTNIANENLAKREQSLVKHISDLEKRLQQLQNEKQSIIHTRQPEIDLDVKKFDETIKILQEEKQEIEDKYKDEMEKRNVLETQMQEQSDLIMDLEAKLERLQDQPDASKLLAAMESDKVAASRAVEQNKKLKEQLEELHDGFIEMSISKLELAEKLGHEQHQCRELSEKLTETTSSIEHLHSVIATKDRELTEIRETATDLEKQFLQQNQLTDRLRHYEVQDSSSDYLQQELQQAKIIVEKLTIENTGLQSQINKETEENLEVKVLKEKIEHLRQINADLRENSDSIIDNDASDISDREQKLLDKEKAMEKLEDRFKKTMLDVANLTEEKQRLEHLVMQLQSETETIGEYVTLYQCQRAMLKEKTLEKDEQLQRLAHDREEMKQKLDELNSLIQKLVLEKDVIPKELLNHHLLQKISPCEDHKNEDQNETNNGAIVGNNENNNENYGTAGKIIALLSEIKTSNLVQPGDSTQNFHPCPWCSGQLITV